MKLIKLVSVLFVLILYNANSLAETKTDCSSMEADTGVKIYEKLKCKMGKNKDESLGKKIKNLFKKKN